MYSHMSGAEDIEPTVQTVRERQRCLDRIAWTEEEAVSNGATPIRDKMDYEAGVRLIIGECTLHLTLFQFLRDFLCDNLDNWDETASIPRAAVTKQVQPSACW